MPGTCATLDTDNTNSASNTPKGTTMDTMTSGTRRRSRRGTILVLALVLAVFGFGAYLVLDAQKYTSGDAPLPDDFSAANTQPANPGPQIGVVGFKVITPENMGANHLFIPSVDPTKVIYASLEANPVSHGDLVIPGDPGILTLHDAGGQPCGSQGTVLIAGHVANRGMKGALYPLSTVAPGSPVYITCADGTLTRWAATTAVRNKKSDLPEDVFDATGPRRAVIVTCGGRLMSNGHYEDNVRLTLTPAP